MSVSAVNLREAFHAGRKVRLHGIHLPAATRTTGGKPVAEEMMAEQNFGAVPEANPGGYNFGTFGGVYTPALLTILGLVMFMRINFVLGEAGLFRTILILAIGASITFATGLSIAAIATNTEVKGGGAYYLISRWRFLSTSSAPPKRSSTAGRDSAPGSPWSTRCWGSS